MELNDLLSKSGIEPSQVLVVRHAPPEAKLRKALPHLAQEQPDIFNAYQQVQNKRMAGALRACRYLASFIARPTSRAILVGVFEIGECKDLPREEFWGLPGYDRLGELGLVGLPEDGSAQMITVDLTNTSLLANYKGRLIIDWPPPGLSWYRWAHRGKFEVKALLEDSALVPPMPPWDEIVLTWEELQVLASDWRNSLAHWRGIYYIFDVSDGFGYVGSAYGGSNLLGRWLAYSSTGHGGNVRLRGRDPKNFRFSILQRVSPDLEADEVIQLESTWKARLHTRSEFGLNDN